MLGILKNSLLDAKDNDIVNKKNCIKEAPHNKEEIIPKYLKEIEGIEIVDFLDSGSESNVYHISILSKNNNQKKDAIMKLILDKRKSKNKEVYISKILKNKNIIDCYTNSDLEQENLSFLIIEYAKYGNFRNFNQKVLNRTYFSESLICYLAYQILNGIKYMHICKIAHMDLKPQNIVMDQFLNAKIIEINIL
jgi:serine/threonine protein kinase